MPVDLSISTKMAANALDLARAAQQAVIPLKEDATNMAIRINIAAERIAQVAKNLEKFVYTVPVPYFPTAMPTTMKASIQPYNTPQKQAEVAVMDSQLDGNLQEFMKRAKQASMFYDCGSSACSSGTDVVTTAVNLWSEQQLSLPSVTLSSFQNSHNSSSGLRSRANAHSSFLDMSTSSCLDSTEARPSRGAASRRATSASSDIVAARSWSILVRFLGLGGPAVRRARGGVSRGRHSSFLAISGEGTNMASAIYDMIFLRNPTEQHFVSEVDYSNALEASELQHEQHDTFKMVQKAHNDQIDAAEDAAGSSGDIDNSFDADEPETKFAS